MCCAGAAGAMQREQAEELKKQQELKLTAMTGDINACQRQLKFASRLSAEHVVMYIRGKQVENDLASCCSSLMS